ncbi:5-(carboxyamino)imidazole ribonucleotide synthase [Erythromicrobium ramosum]|uniref:N5-carboxyaminoimidazole ribonucleotide synthase n=1 Tax=Erythrobacter ramosus TaxID=35811 RepID=A0A6I4UIE3_9SPHN|nr:5-(carboxyamino)imidazole ribonucleotide synthase [Erythrobacter ramosus]MBB3774752.1 5-(carboxyamino)imidazole ribonucleotide synthase [Erythrobacter ramosus]MXP37604.1 5-(carboxyamino)imidazole ribonucleotide synthase [Erythrobacter ramosus]
MLPPGSTIGILGGGQLGRMMAVAALQLGYKVIGFAPEGDNVAADASSDFITADWDDAAALAEFTGRCDVVTWEFENVPLSTVAAIPQHLLACPARALEVAQDRLSEKAFAASLGGTPAPYARVETEDDFAAALVRVGTPGILKTARDGYDGKGQWRVRSALEASGVRFPGVTCIYEVFVIYETEFSVILVRGKDGSVKFWDSTANLHDGGMLAQSILPAGALVEAQVPAARQLAAKVADALGYVGVLTLEFFATREGPMFNEMAPRVHNSGHWTIEGAATSQFENHIRAICGLPLGVTKTRFEAIEMRNIVGDDALRAHAILAEPGEPHLHLYGKREVREGRKMGHVTRVGHAIR